MEHHICSTSHSYGSCGPLGFISAACRSIGTICSAEDIRRSNIEVSAFGWLQKSFCTAKAFCTTGGAFQLTSGGGDKAIHSARALVPDAVHERLRLLERPALVREQLRGARVEHLPPRIFHSKKYDSRWSGGFFFFECNQAS